MSKSTQTSQAPLLRTKLHRPVAPGDFLCRSRLHDLMDPGQESPLTLASAPAGYGKSLLVSQWIASRSIPCAWLSLDGSDSTVELFVDYHRIRGDSRVHELMRLLLAHPPRCLHLVIVARRDPPLGLTRLRAQAGFTEIRLTDLRFTDAETRLLLQALLAFTVSDDTLANLQNELEGLAVGLRLVSLALRHTPDRNGFLRNLHGGIQLTQTYLLQEVIAVQQPALRHCLLRASLLERFCAGVCDGTSWKNGSPSYRKRSCSSVSSFCWAMSGCSFSTSGSRPFHGFSTGSRPCSATTAVGTHSAAKSP